MYPMYLIFSTTESLTQESTIRLYIQRRHRHDSVSSRNTRYTYESEPHRKSWLALITSPIGLHRVAILSLFLRFALILTCPYLRQVFFLFLTMRLVFFVIRLLILWIVLLALVFHPCRLPMYIRAEGYRCKCSTNGYERHRKTLSFDDFLQLTLCSRDRRF